MRIIFNLYSFSHTAPLFRKHCKLTIHNIHKQQIAIFMYFYCKHLLPRFLYDCFINYRDVTNYETRKSGLFYLPKYTHEFSRTTIAYGGLRLWNQLPSELKVCPTMSTYRIRFKNYLVNVYIVR